MAKKKRVHLPHELITEVLLRLPVKSVLRCKCVCKSWLSLISDPHFGTLHFQLAASPTHKLLFMEYSPRQTLSIDFHKWLDDDSASSLSPDFLHPESYPEIGGSCRGFLFLNCYGDFYLWNPSTGFHKEIPASPIIITALASISASNYKALELFYGFGYDMSSDDYMVVLGSYKHTYNSPPGSCSIDLEIYSLRANEWEQLQFDSDLPYRKTVSSQIGSFLNGSIHWLVYNNDTRMDIIIAFDLKETTMSEIALPNDFYADDFSPKIYDLLVFGGLIGVWTVEMSTLKIWVMQEYDVHSSWTKTFDFSFHPAPDFSPICFTNGGDIVGPVADGGLAKLDDKGDLLEYHSYGNIHFARSQMVVYTESLLSLPGGTEQA